ncbi:FLYWCH family member 2 isoform X2 [Onychomys torridus]|uniref:FLYWCH family member 2 isoform X2 n=2 Tax=Onychomys torridus TaxID=38674 RepID=UPI00167F93DD|nr:FLYWCH family member 2 isoform X2 [Onychomys torridus]
MDRAVHSPWRRTEPLDSQVPGQGGGGKGDPYLPGRVWPEGQAAGSGMPQPTPSEQEGESMKGSQEPTPQPGMDVVPAAPRKPRKCSKLVLLTASKDSAKVAGAKRKGVHCIMSLGAPGPATLAKALLKTHPEAQRAIEAAPQEPEQKRSKLDPDGPEDSGWFGVSSSSPEETTVLPEAPSTSP